MVGEGTRSGFTTSNSAKASKYVCVSGLRGDVVLGELEGEMNIKEEK